jgi:arylsulfatase A
MKRLLLSALVLGGVAFRPEPTLLNPKQPNIIYVLVDDMGVEEIESYGGKLIATPNLNRMAREGMRFTQHYAGTSVCAPSRCALMTGFHTGHGQVRGNKQMQPHGQLPLSDSILTVAEVLRGVGYRTALVGKWGLGIEGTTGEPTRQGFDSYYGYLDQVLAHNNFPAYLLRDGKRSTLPNEVVWEPKTAVFKGLGSYTPKPVAYSNDLFTDEAVGYIKQQAVAGRAGKPFFLYLAYTLPHNNGEAPTDQRFQAPTLAPHEAKPWPDLDKQYAATISRLDTYMGRLMTTLRQTGQANNTIILFSSDNGSTEDIPARFAAHNRLRGFKRSPYEGGIRAPLLAWWPGRIQPGTVSNVPTAQWDFLATAAALANVPALPKTDGISLLPTLMGGGKQATHPHLYWEFHEQGGWQAIRQGNWKLIYFVKANRYELYDLATDPGERTDLSGQQPARLASLTEQLGQARTESGTFTFGR